MEFEEFIKGLIEAYQRQHKIEEANNHTELLSLCHEDIINKKVFRIARLSSEESSNQHYKTLIVAGLPDISYLKHSIKWAALSNGYLVDPEISDLYLFITWQETTPSLDECLRIEASEEFCRKYVIHPEEDMESFIARTFFSTVADSGTKSLGSDPINHAFNKLSEDNDWFSKEEQEVWKDAFLKDLDTHELIDLILKPKK